MHVVHHVGVEQCPRRLVNEHHLTDFWDAGPDVPVDVGRPQCR